MVSFHVNYFFQIFGPALILLGVITQAQTMAGVENAGERKDVTQMGGAAFPPHLSTPFYIGLLF